MDNGPVMVVGTPKIIEYFRDNRVLAQDARCNK